MKTVLWLAVICGVLLGLHVIALTLQMTVPELVTAILQAVFSG